MRGPGTPLPGAGHPSAPARGLPHLRGPPHLRRDTLTCVRRAWDSGPAGRSSEGCAGPSKVGRVGPRLQVEVLVPAAGALTPRPGDNEAAGWPGERRQLATSKQPGTSSPSVTEARLSCPRRFWIGPPATRSGHTGSSLGHSAVLRSPSVGGAAESWRPWRPLAADWTWLQKAGSQLKWGGPGRSLWRRDGEEKGAGRERGFGAFPPPPPA